VLPEDITVDHKDELVSVEASVPDAQDDVTELFTVEQGREPFDENGVIGTFFK